MSDDNQNISLTINGKQVQSVPGRLLIDVAEEHDIFVPRFCYHPGLESVAACRMCLVEIEGSRRPLEPACATQVADGMIVRTDSEAAASMQESVLELLLINHPLDCPICDRGGECPLQDQTMKFGPGRSMYQEDKRHFRKAVPISELVVLDRERCVLCWRCVRFCDEVSGDKFIDLLDRGSHTQINTAQDKPFDSYFSGNTIQICPVGALTSSSYRFQSRPWDLRGVQSTCSYCAVGCPISLEHRAGEVLRAQALPNDEVNSFWSCDKGRFGHRYVSHPERLKAPLVRRTARGSDEFAETSWEEALALIAGKLKGLTAGSAGLIGGSHTLNEDLYAASRLFRGVIGSPNLDFRTFDCMFPYDALTKSGVTGSSATFNDLDKARTIVWAGPDPREELPVLYLRLRKAVLQHKARLLIVHPRRISLSEFGSHVAASAIEAEGPSVFCIGPRFPGAADSAHLEDLNQAMKRAEEAKLLLLAPNANSQGAIDMGLYPGLDAGHRAGPAGMGTAEMLAAAARGDLEFLWILGADLLEDFPDRALAKAALASDAFVVVSELFPTPTARSADVILPACAFGEKEGSFTNLERRIQKVNPAVPAPGIARPDWSIFSDVAARLGTELGWKASSDVAAEIARELPTHAGFAWEALEQDEIPQTQVGTEGESEGAGWPLSWELRQIDATRRSGFVWKGPGTATSKGPSSSPKPSSSWGLVLITSRLLYDAGAMAGHAPELRNLTPAPFVEVSPEEASARGLKAGERVKVSSSKGRVTLELKISSNTPPGLAFMPFSQPGGGANTLIDLASDETRVEVSR